MIDPSALTALNAGLPDPASRPAPWADWQRVGHFPVVLGEVEEWAGGFFVTFDVEGDSQYAGMGAMAFVSVCPKCVGHARQDLARKIGRFRIRGALLHARLDDDGDVHRMLDPEHLPSGLLTKCGREPRSS